MVDSEINPFTVVALWANGFGVDEWPCATLALANVVARAYRRPSAAPFYKDVRIVENGRTWIPSVAADAATEGAQSPQQLGELLRPVLAATRAAGRRRERALLPHYAALVGASVEQGWPERFVSDLVEHDRATLAREDPDRPFGWILSRSATHLVYPSAAPIDGAGHYAHEVPAMCLDAFGDDCRYFWWDGRTLRPVANANDLGRMLEDASAPPSGDTSLRASAEDAANRA